MLRNDQFQKFKERAESARVTLSNELLITSPSSTMLMAEGPKGEEVEAFSFLLM